MNILSTCSEPPQEQRSPKELMSYIARALDLRFRFDWSHGKHSLSDVKLSRRHTGSLVKAL